MSGDLIVWVDERNKNWDIYGYNLTEQKEYQISTNLDNDAWPDISDKMIVYVTYEKKGDPQLQIRSFPVSS